MALVEVVYRFPGCTIGVPMTSFRRTVFFGRLMLALAAGWPVFLIWAIRGQSALKDILVREDLTSWSPVIRFLAAFWFEMTCCLCAIIPNVAVYLYLRGAELRSNKAATTFQSGVVEQRRELMLSYLFAVLSPLYASDLSSVRELLASSMMVLMMTTAFFFTDMAYLNPVLRLTGLKMEIVLSKRTGTDPESSVPILLPLGVPLPPAGPLQGAWLFDIIFIVKNDA